MEITLNRDVKTDISQIMFCNQLIKGSNIIMLSLYAKKKFKIIGWACSKENIDDINFSRAIEIAMASDTRPKIKIYYNDLQGVKDLKIGQLTKFTNLRLYPVKKNNEFLIMLSATNNSKALHIFPDIINKNPTEKQNCKLEHCLSTSFSRRTNNYCTETIDFYESLSPLLIINLYRYAIRTETGPKFCLSDLEKISDKIAFIGIVMSIEKNEAIFRHSYTIKIKDLLTNDSINVFVVYNISNKGHVDLLESIKVYYKLRVKCTRMVNRI
jgi:hypothetical protein